MTNAMSKGLYLALAQLGIQIENIKETQEQLTLYISVPEHSYKTNDYGVETAGENLAKNFKRSLGRLGVKRLEVRYRIRKNDTWTKDKENASLLQARKELFRSQY